MATNLENFEGWLKAKTLKKCLKQAALAGLCGGLDARAVQLRLEAAGVDGEAASLAISKVQQSIARADAFLAKEEENGAVHS